MTELQVSVPPGMSQEETERYARNTALAYHARQGRLIAFSRYTMPRYRPVPHLVHLARELETLERQEGDRLIALMPPRHGKLVAHDTAVPTPSGFRQHGTLAVGDLVYAPNGQAVPVLAVSQEDEASLLVRFSDGSEIAAHPGHEWPVYDRARGRHRIMETSVIAARQIRSSGRYPLQIEYVAPLGAVDPRLPIDPYTLGVWLGDGTATKGAINHGPADDFRLPYRVSSRQVHSYTGVATTYYAGLWADLRAAGVANNKHIPATYLWGSEATRWALLSGLIDTDGCVGADGRVRFVNTNTALIDGVIHLARSFGYRCSVFSTEATQPTSGVNGRHRVWTVGFSPQDRIPARLSRKRRAASAISRRRAIVGVEPARHQPGRCIQVEGGQYLVGETLIPTHNSELVSIRFPAHYMVRHPDRSFITASYGEVLATLFGRKARNVATLDRVRSLYPEVNLAADSKAANLWSTDVGGSFLAVGIGGAITGFGAHHLNIDDPIRKREEAESPIYRERVFDWFQAEAYTRLEPGGTISLTMTPWHYDDLAARLVALQEFGGDQWKVLRFPAVAEGDDVLGRKVGEALWPERFPLEQLERIRTNIGEREWNALYQLRPSPPEGHIFKWWPRWRELPADITGILIGLDTAYTQKERSDYTAVSAWVVAGSGEGQRVHLVAALRWKLETPEAEKHVAYFFQRVRDRWPHVPVRLLYRQRVAIDRIVAQHLRAKNIPAIGVNLPSMDKEALANIVAVEFEADKALIPVNAVWLPPWQQEHIDFPNGANDDWVEGTIVVLWYAFRSTPFKRPEGPISVFDRRY